MPARTLYVSRPLLNADELIAWAREQGFRSTLLPEDMHVTVAFSKTPIPWEDVPRTAAEERELAVPETDEGDAAYYGDARGPGWRLVKPLGSEGAVVLCFWSDELTERWAEIVKAGASWDYPEYVPHVTITYDGGGPAPEAVKPYLGRLVFGPERVKEIEPKQEISERATKSLYTSDVGSPDKAGQATFSLAGKITKFDDERRVVYGWASVIEKDGVPVVDTQDDRISEDELVKAAQEFVAAYRAGDVMHDEKKRSDLVESVVFTHDLQKALGIDLGQVGWFVGFKVGDDATWQRVKKGELRAFSIGGDAIREKAAV